MVFLACLLVLCYNSKCIYERGSNMANIKQQIKRNKTNEKARQRNASFKSKVRTAIKKVRVAVEANDKKTAEALLPEAISLIDKSVVKGIQHKNAAARQKSSLMNAVNSLD